MHRLQPRRALALGSAVRVTAAAVATPPTLLAYVVLVRWLQGNPLHLVSLASPDAWLFAVVASVTGVAVAYGHALGLRVAPPLSVVALLGWPWLFYAGPIGGIPGYHVVTLVAVLLFAGTEALARNPDWLRASGDDRATRLALAVGVAHFLVGFAVHAYARRFLWMEYTGLAGPALMGAVHVVSGLGLVAIGAVPVWLWARRRLVAPAVVAGGWFAWGLYETALHWGSYPLGHFYGFRWNGVPPAPDYMLTWTVPMMAILVVAGAEWGLQRTGAELSRYVGSAGRE